MKFLCAALIASAALATPAAARHRHHHHNHNRLLPTFSYEHNYGPGLQPGSFAYYDGPLAARCAQSAAAYRGQDGRRHPCL
jgi:hypothetical protein